MSERPSHFEQMPFIGEAKNIEARADTAETRKVKNKVLWANQKLPFNIEVGKPLKLARFAVLEEMRKHSERQESYEIRHGHGRSAIIGRMVFKDTSTPKGAAGWYRDIDAKGIGHVVLRDGDFGVHPLKLGADTENYVYGLLDEKEAREDAKWSEKFHAAGIRTDRTIAITELEQIFEPEWGKITPQELRETDEFNIDKSYVPVIQYRAFGVASRINWSRLHPKPLKSDIRDQYNDARICVANEIGEDEKNFTYSDYLVWACKTLGIQIARMHSKGWVHENLRPYQGQVPSNVTLDIRIVDKDRMRELSPNKNYADRLRKEEFFEKNLVYARGLIEDLQKGLSQAYGLKHPGGSLGKTKALDGHQTPFLTPVEALKEFDTAYTAEVLRLENQKK